MLEGVQLLTVGQEFDSHRCQVLLPLALDVVHGSVPIDGLPRCIGVGLHPFLTREALQIFYFDTIVGEEDVAPTKARSRPDGGSDVMGKLGIDEQDALVGCVSTHTLLSFVWLLSL